MEVKHDELMEEWNKRLGKKAGVSVLVIGTKGARIPDLVVVDWKTRRIIAVEVLNAAFHKGEFKNQRTLVLDSQRLRKYDGQYSLIWYTSLDSALNTEHIDEEIEHILPGRLAEIKCPSCKHQWEPRVHKPKRCPKCKRFLE